MKLQAKIMLLFCSSVLFVGITIGLFYSINATNLIEKSFGNQAKKVSEQAAKQINMAAFERVLAQIGPGAASKANQQKVTALPEYNDIREKLLAIKRITGLKYLYTMARLAGNTYVYVVDGAQLNDQDISLPGEVETEVFADLRNAFATRETQIGEITYNKQWGALLTSYVPLFNKDHQMIGVVGADFDAAQIYTSIERNRRTGICILLIGLAITLTGSYFISRLISVPVMKLVAVAEKLAAGDVDITIQSATKDEIGQLTASFAKMVASIREQANAAAKIAVGDPAINLTEKSERDILSKNLNLAVQNIREQSLAAQQIAAGDLDVAIKVKSDQDILAKSMNQVVAALRDLIGEMEHMSGEHDAGDIDVFIPEEKFQGSYRAVAKGVNDMVKGHISVKKKAMACVAEFAKGNFNAALEKFPGKKAFINDHIETLRGNLQAANAAVSQLIVACQDGKLNERADLNGLQGDWAALLKGLNGLLDAIIEPVREAAAVLDEMATGNLQTLMKGDYRGDHARIKRSLNATIQSFNDLLHDISVAATQVSAGTKHLSDASLILSQGATEQASAVQELSASLEELSAQTKLNAGHADEANRIAANAQETAVQGNARMKEMLQAMAEINEASSQISKIIKVIDEIAFQTNLLALNAAVEAARAGQHGKGFSVVAEEVRHLAARSAEAAKETTAMIETSIKKAEDGAKIADHTAGALNEIVAGTAKVAGLVDNIAAASNQQATGIAQINQGITQVSQVVQTNTATSQETASASDELAIQAEMLKQQVARFALAGTGMGN